MKEQVEVIDNDTKFGFRIGHWDPDLIIDQPNPYMSSIIMIHHGREFGVYYPNPTGSIGSALLSLEVITDERANPYRKNAKKILKKIWKSGEKDDDYLYEDTLISMPGGLNTSEHIRGYIWEKDVVLLLTETPNKFIGEKDQDLYTKIIVPYEIYKKIAIECHNFYENHDCIYEERKQELEKEFSKINKERRAKGIEYVYGLPPELEGIPKFDDDGPAKKLALEIFGWEDKYTHHYYPGEKPPKRKRNYGKKNNL